MRTIRKGAEPASLRKHRKSGGTYGQYNQTDDVRDGLLRDQGAICCYCMQRITRRGMKIEHWASQRGHPDSTVDWTNLLGACTGGDGERRAIRHCDTSRGNAELHINPLDRVRTCERLLRYLANGEIQSNDVDVHNDVHVTLNLNNDRLRRMRQQVYDMLIQRILREEQGPWPAALIERELAAWKQRDRAGLFREYCQVAIYFLEKWLERK